MALIGTLIIGLVVGLLARFITPGPNPHGIIVTIVIGIVGAVIATYGGQALHLYAPGEAAGFAGSVIGGAPRIVEVKGMDLDAACSPAMLYINNLDRPGFIGALGALLGEAGVNIATFNLGRRAAGEDAIALVGIDSAPTDALLAKVCALPQVKEARALTF